jgi:lycopene cyclase domain-containing protein
MALYLLLTIASVSVPFVYSFEKHMRFISWWKEVFLSISIVAFIFIIWDVIFTSQGIWGFNEDYLVGFHILNLPVEEWLFFICIPYASVFTHYAIRYFFPDIILSSLFTRGITLILIITLLIVVVLNTDRAYTAFNYSFLVAILVYGFLTGNRELRTFYISFLIILIPFFIVNGILTGSFIEEPIVWYNNAENLGIRLGTIPIEDVGYAFSLIYLNIILIEKFKRRSSVKR